MDRMMHTVDPSYIHSSILNIFQCYTLIQWTVRHHICFIEVTTLWVHGTSGRERGGFTSKPSQEWFSVLQWMWDLSIAVTGYSGVSRSRCSVQLWLSGVWQFTCGELCMHVAYFTWSDLCCLYAWCLWWDMLTRCSSITYYCIACIALILILSLIIKYYIYNLYVYIRATCLAICVYTYCMIQFILSLHAHIQRGARSPATSCFYYYSVWQGRTWHTGEMPIFSLPSNLTQGQVGL